MDFQNVTTLASGRLASEPHGHPIIAALLVSIAVARIACDAASALLLLTWATTAIATAKFVEQSSGPQITAGNASIIMAIAVTWMTRRVATRRAATHNAP